MAFECLAGHRPFDADSPVATALAHLNDPVPDLPPDVPADLAAVVRRAMAKEPDQRYADGDAFAAALRDPAGAAATAYVPVPAGAGAIRAHPGAGAVAARARPRRRSTAHPSDDRRSPWPIVLLVLALVAAIVLIIVVATQANDDDDDPTASDTSSAPTSSAPTTEDTPTEESSSAPAEVQIDEDDYVGRNVDEVADRAARQGARGRHPADRQPG